MTPEGLPLVPADELPFPAERPSLPWLEHGVAILDPDDAILEVSPALAAWLQKPTESLAGKPIEALLAACCPGWAEAWRELRSIEGSFARARWALPGTGDDPTRWLEAELVRNPAGTVLRLNSALPELPDWRNDNPGDESTSHTPARDLVFRLLRSEEQLRQLMERWPGIVFSQRPDMTFYFVSPRIEALTGIPQSDWVTKAGKFWDVVADEDLKQVSQHLQRTRESRTETLCTFRIRHAVTGKIAFIVEQRKAVFTSGGLLLAYEGTWLDVTLQTLLEKRLTAAAWKETLAAMTMGLAHNFRNLLTSVYVLTEALQAQMDDQNPLRRTLEPIQAKAKLATESMRWLLECHEERTRQKSYVDINQLASDLMEMGRFFLPRAIKLETVLTPGQLPVYVDAFELRQLFMSVVIYGGNGMPGGGRILVQTSRHENTPEIKPVRGAMPRLPVICLAMSDEAPLIPPEQLPALCESFFTAESMYRGAALGVPGIMHFLDRHPGALSLESAEGKGTTLKLWLPEADFTEAEKEQPAPQP